MVSMRLEWSESESFQANLSSHCPMLVPECGLMFFAILIALLEVIFRLHSTG